MCKSSIFIIRENTATGTEIAEQFFAEIADDT